MTQTTPRRRPLLACATLAGLAATSALSASAQAAGPCQYRYTVTKTADTSDGNCSSSDCSLREAIAASNSCSGPHEIVLSALAYPLTIANPNPAQPDNSIDFGDLDVTRGVTIIGNGATIDGRDATRIFDVHSGTFVLNNAVLYRGAAQQAAEAAQPGRSGGALHIASGGVAGLYGVTVRGSRTNYAAGVAGIQVRGRITLEDTVFEANTAHPAGISVLENAAGSNISMTRGQVIDNVTHGKTVSNSGRLTFNSVSFRNNVNLAPNEGASAIDNFGGQLYLTDCFFEHHGGPDGVVRGQSVPGGSESLVRVSQSTFKNNRARVGYGGAVSNAGATYVTGGFFRFNRARNGGILHLAGRYAAVSRSTLDFSQADEAGGAIYLTASNARITDSAITRNTARSGGAIYATVAPGLVGATTLLNSWISGNSTLSAVTGTGNVHVASAFMMLIKNSTFSTTDGSAGPHLSNSQSGIMHLAYNLIQGRTGEAECAFQAPQWVTSHGFNLARNGDCGLVHANDLPTAVVETTTIGGVYYAGNSTDRAIVSVPLLDAGSPAIDRGEPFSETNGSADRPGCYATDARGRARPINGACDIGASEYDAT
jgi:CSLREA domain-containing protein